MKLQKGKFLINNIDELDTLDTDTDGLKNVIRLDYMGMYEYETNSIPISRMIIEYFKDNYVFYPVDIYNQKNEQMFIYANSLLIKDEDYINKLAKEIIDKNLSLWEAINYSIGKRVSFEELNDFWWSIDNDYFVFFGENKKEIINYFIYGCYDRDGKKEGIARKLEKAGYSLK